MKQFYTKKALGQHFLTDELIAQNIVNAIQPLGSIPNVLEIGPGLGVLTKYLLQSQNCNIYVAELDDRIIEFAQNELHIKASHIIKGDVLRVNPQNWMTGEFVIIGNFPYNISSQILFMVLDMIERVPMLVGMFQREMAKRVVAKTSTKDYGVLSVMVQAYYQPTYLFEVDAQKFNPPPKVQSAVIKLIRKEQNGLGCDEKFFKQIVKAGFNQRRKKLSNALLVIPGAKQQLIELGFADKRAENLSVSDFILLTNAIVNHEL